MLNRRDAIRGAALSFGPLLFGTLTLAGPAGAAAAVSAPPLAWTPRALSAEQARLVEVVAEHIVPTTDTPGARAAGVPQFIDRALAEYYLPADAARIRAGLDRLDADAKAAHGAPFLALSGPDQVAQLARYDAERAPFFTALKDLTLTGYFQSKPGATLALRYDPVPGDYKGCVPLKDIGRGWAT